MPKARDYHLKDQQLAEIEKAIRHDKRPEVRQRCTVIRLLHMGHKPEEIAKMQAISIPTVYGWLKRWQRDGIEGLANKPKSGRPAKADDAYCQAENKKSTKQDSKKSTFQEWKSPLASFRDSLTFG